jgi:hypothetical protein
MVTWSDTGLIKYSFDAPVVNIVPILGFRRRSADLVDISRRIVPPGYMHQPLFRWADSPDRKDASVGIGPLGAPSAAGPSAAVFPLTYINDELREVCASAWQMKTALMQEAP